MDFFLPKTFRTCPHRAGLEAVPPAQFKLSGPPTLKSLFKGSSETYQLKDDTSFNITKIQQPIYCLALNCDAPSLSTDEHTRINIEVTLDGPGSVKLRTSYKITAAGWICLPVPVQALQNIRVSHSYEKAITVYDFKILRATEPSVFSCGLAFAERYQERCTQLGLAHVVPDQCDEANEFLTTIVCADEQTVVCHPFVLAARCGFFAQRAQAKGGLGTVELKDVPLAVLVPALRYFYSGDPFELFALFDEMSTGMDPAGGLEQFLGASAPIIALAEFLDAPSLLRVCEDWLYLRHPHRPLDVDVLAFIGEHLPTLSSRLGKAMVEHLRSEGDEQLPRVLKQLEALPPKFFAMPSRTELGPCAVHLPPRMITPHTQGLLAGLEETQLRAAEMLTLSRASTLRLSSDERFTIVPEIDGVPASSGCLYGTDSVPARIARRNIDSVNLAWEALGAEVREVPVHLVQGVSGAPSGEVLASIFDK